MANLFSGYIVKITVKSGGQLVDSQSAETCKCFDNLGVVYWLNLCLYADMTHRNFLFWLATEAGLVIFVKLKPLSKFLDLYWLAINKIPKAPNL